MQQQARPTGQVRLAALDGMRGIAVLAVLAYHAHLPWARGGYLGVDVFFILSGYLITVQLLRTDRARSMRESARFYGLFLAHRATRLLPALAVMLVGSWLLLPWLDLNRSQAGACAVRAATYSMNMPSPEAARCPAVWHISWSLAAEVQFYAIWPVLLLGVLALARSVRVGTLKAASAIVLGIFGAAVVWQLWLWTLPDGKQRFLFGPDGRSVILLVGCAVGLLSAQRRGWLGSWLARPAASWIALAALMVGFGWGRSTGPIPAVGFYLLVGAATTVLVAQAVSVTGPSLPALVTNPVMTWVGRVSYSLYLWHEVGYALSRSLGLASDATTTAVGVALALAAAAASYHWIEVPAQRSLRKLLPRPDAAQSAEARRSIGPQLVTAAPVGSGARAADAAAA